MSASTVLRGDVAKAVAALKEKKGGDLLVIGSAELVKTLADHDLVDEYRMMIDPLVVGGGKRLFAEDGALNELELSSTARQPRRAQSSQRTQ